MREQEQEEEEEEVKQQEEQQEQVSLFLIIKCQTLNLSDFSLLSIKFSRVDLFPVFLEPKQSELQEL